MLKKIYAFLIYPDTVAPQIFYYDRPAARHITAEFTLKTGACMAECPFGGCLLLTA